MVERNIKQIPVLPLIARSYAFVLMGLRPLLTATWPWMGVVYIAGRAAGLNGGLIAEGAVSSGLWILIIANLVASSAVSVLCHRIIILGEWPAGLRSVHFGRREIRYLLALVGVGFSVTFMIVLFAGLIRVVGLEGKGANVGAVVVLLISLVLYARVSLAFPDLAVAEDRFPWHVWGASHGHAARIILGMILSGVPLIFIVQQLLVVVAILQTKGLVGIAMVVDLFAFIITFLAIMSSTAFLSFVYKFLVLGSFLPPIPSPEEEEKSND